MAERAAGSFGRKAAGLVVSLGVHLLVLALVLLIPAARLTAPPRSIQVSLQPPPKDYSWTRPDPAAARAPSLAHALPAERTPRPFRQPPTAPGSPSPLQARPAPALPTSSPAAAAPASTPTAGGLARGAVQAPAGQAAAQGSSQAMVDVLRQTFGCSSGQRANRTDAEKADCFARGTVRAADIPDHPEASIPAYKRDYYDALVAARNSPNHLPGTDCVVNQARGGGINLLNPLTCVKPPGAGPKPGPRGAPVGARVEDAADALGEK